MSNDGKGLENKLHNWLKSLGIYHHRFYDARSMGRADAQSRPADYWVWHKRKLIYIECKERLGALLPFNAFRPSQLKSAKNSPQNDIIYIGLISLKGVLYAVKMRLILGYIATVERKSIPMSFFEQYATAIKDKKALLGYLNTIEL